MDSVSALSPLAVESSLSVDALSAPMGAERRETAEHAESAPPLDVGAERERLGRLVELMGACGGPTALPPQVTGYSGARLLGLLQRLHQRAQNASNIYLEVGVFRGLSLVAVGLAEPRRRALGIDNFSQFDPSGENCAAVGQTLDRLGLSGQVGLLNADFEDALETLGDALQGDRVGTYFVDGPHDYRSQHLCLQLIRPWLAPDGVIVVDDANYRHVRLANRDFLHSNPEFKLLFEAYTPGHPEHLCEAGQRAAREGFWNGVNVLVRDPEGHVPRRYPSTLRDRSLFFNDHEVHAARYADYAPGALRVLELELQGQPAAARALLERIRQRVHAEPSVHRGDQERANTHSQSLPSYQLHAPKALSSDPI